MFDNLKAEINDFRLKSADKDKAEYYRKSLENERASREQADKQIIDLLHNVKNRYDIKINSYADVMAKSKKDSNSSNNNNNNAATTSSNQNNSNEASGKGKKGKNKSNKDATQEASNQNQVDSWGSNDKKSPEKTNGNSANDVWGNDDNAADDWGTSNQNDNDTWGNDANQSNNADWGNENQTNNDTWTADNQESNGDDSNTNDPSANGGWGVNNKQADVGGNWGQDDSDEKKESTDGSNPWRNTNKSSLEKANKVSPDKKNKNTNNDNSNQSSANCNTSNLNDNSNKGKKNKNKSKDISQENNQNTESNPWATSDNPSSDKKGSGKDKSAENSGWGSEKRDTSKCSGDNQDDGKKKADEGKKKQDDIKKKSDEPSKKSDESVASPKPWDKNRLSGQVDTGSKEYLEVRSQLWTAKLDIRLLERDKSKLSDELEATKKERDDLLRKLNLAKQEQDTLKVRVRGLTVDLVSTNDEIHKLNGRIDELECEKRNKERDASSGESKRRAIENKYKEHQQKIANLESELILLKEEKDEYFKRASELERKNDRLASDLSHSKNLIRTLKDGCAMVEDQAKTFEVRHDTVVMSKADMERELIAIKEESSRHITTINKLQKSNEQLVNAFMLSAEAHDETKRELENLQQEFANRLDAYKVENHRLVEANSQLTKLVDYLRARKR